MDPGLRRGDETRTFAGFNGRKIDPLSTFEKLLLLYVRSGYIAKIASKSLSSSLMMGAETD